MEEAPPKGRCVLKVEKALPSTDAEKVKKFNEAIKPVIEGYTEIEIKLTSQVGAGDDYQTITNIVPIREDGAVDLVHKGGEVMLIDFWATWCPPCQAPMQHNQDMLVKRGEDWKGKLQIVGISIDQGKDIVCKHVDDKGWGNVVHYHRAGSNCSDVYSVKGVPHVMLIDKFGKIAFKGHPSNCDLEKEMDKLISADKPFSCDEKKEDAPKEEADEYKEGLDQVAIFKEMDDFTEVATNLTKDATLKQQKLMRAFCVLLYQSKYDPTTGKTTHKYENYRVLVGQNWGVDTVKAILEEKVKGSFEVVLRE